MNALEHRVPPPIAGTITAVLLWAAARGATASFPPDRVRLPLAIVLSVVAVGIALAGFATFRRAGTTVDPVNIDAASSLVTHGIFGVTRNPMYLGMVLSLVAEVLWLGTPWLLFVPLAFAAFLQRFQILPEERVMRQKFGAPYEAYQARVRRWI